MKIQAYVASLKEQGHLVAEIADILGVTASQVAKYRQGVIKIPRIDVAINVFLHSHKALFPYSREAIIELIEEDQNVQKN